MVYAEEHDADLITCMPIFTRKTFGCNQFEEKVMSKSENS